jgi:hypothetical protein
LETYHQFLFFFCFLLFSNANNMKKGEADIFHIAADLI